MPSRAHASAHLPSSLLMRLTLSWVPLFLIPPQRGKAGKIGVNSFRVKLALPLTLALARHA